MWRVGQYSAALQNWLKEKTEMEDWNFRVAVARKVQLWFTQEYLLEKLFCRSFFFHVEAIYGI